MRSVYVLSTLVVVLMIAVLAAPVYAAAVVATGNWEDAATWDPGVPGASDPAIWNHTNDTVTYGASAGDRSFGNIEMRTGKDEIDENDDIIYTGDDMLYFSSGAGTLTSTGDYVLLGWADDSRGVMSMDGGTFNVQGVMGMSWAWAAIGTSNGGSIVNVRNGATLNATGTHAEGSGLVMGNGVSGDGTGFATLSVLSGGTLNTQSIMFTEHSTNDIHLETGGKINFTGNASLNSDGTIHADSGMAVFSTEDASKSVSIASLLTGSGSVQFDGPGSLALTGANDYTGDTVVQGGTLSISSAYLADGSAVQIAAGAQLALDFVGTDTIGALDFNGIAQAEGTWGASGSGATNINNTYFAAGTGVLNVVTPVPEPSVFVLLATGVVGLLAYAWRRRK